MFASVSSRLLQSSGRQRIIEAAIAVLALAALWMLSFTPQWRQLEFKTFDAYTVLAARGPGDTPVVIVAIDEPTFRELGLHWPFPRRTHADLIERFSRDGARVIAFDLIFAESTNAPDDERLANAIRGARDVVLASTSSPFPPCVLPVRAPAKSASIPTRISSCAQCRPLKAASAG
jgi:adenylate cyclase